MSLIRYKRLLPYLLRHWPLLVLIVVLTLLASLLAALQPWPLKILVDYALGDTALPHVLSTLLSALHQEKSAVALVVLAALSSFGLYCINSVFDAVLSLAWATMGQKTVYELSAALFSQLQRLSLQFHRHNAVGDFLDRLSVDTYSAYTLTNILLVSPIRQSVLLCTLGLVAWQLDPGLTVITFAVVPLMVIVALACGAQLKRLMQHQRQAQAQVMSFVHQTLTSIPIVQAFSTEDANQNYFGLLAARSVASSQRNRLFGSLLNTTNGSIAVISTAIVIFFGGTKAVAGVVTVGSLLVILDYLRSIQAAFRELFTNYSKLKSLEVNIDRIFEIIDSDDKIPEPLTPISFPTGRSRGDICFKSVTFGYELNKPILKKISFTAKAGETIAVVGPSGAGKSTLLSAIPRFFDPWQGQVLMDGLNVRDLPVSVVRSQVGLVLQDPFLLPLSVADNIAYGRPNATRQRVIQAAKIANVDSFVDQLAHGYDTVIGERGATLSGGQKQRISIARALLKDAPILILDEPTSALDVQTERSIMDALDRLMAGRTTFIIAHRLSTVKRANRILVLDQGHLVETGTHQELIDAQGLYARLHYLQAKKTFGAVMR
ncbi:MULTISPECIES: ABC transporter ATP-binding protein [Cyanophyceae]|uniref:ABC transporter ATP-binding protein n=1 Tax=Cyanophyceae TaxID=3028117 RepID=UPI001685475B|nr:MULTISPECIES: ABC transporter ATP-binding protein [Cyanophyceae]MBD1918056.1 ABC transporter ATP-binding protein [Phormidium sp. FACHB-77]MBD2030089.1 ABC transporter ATP-binding protein [Phormidium sp. FACHB-322]MBD2051540.1 ABC transporter ATP-binding protein [Leptolyngbya sp. FACHB-60]